MGIVRGREGGSKHTRQAVRYPCNNPKSPPPLSRSTDGPSFAPNMDPPTSPHRVCVVGADA